LHCSPYWVFNANSLSIKTIENKKHGKKVNIQTLNIQQMYLMYSNDSKYTDQRFTGALMVQPNTLNFQFTMKGDLKSERTATNEYQIGIPIMLYGLQTLTYQRAAAFFSIFSDYLAD
jgi:hypothetical protein